MRGRDGDGGNSREWTTCAVERGSKDRPDCSWERRGQRGDETKNMDEYEYG